MSVRLLALPGSHPCATVAAMLDAKGIAYERRDLLPALSRVWLRATGFPAATVPALRLNGRRVQGSREIARMLDAAWPEPPFFPVDPAGRARVEEIEAWGDSALQSAARRIILFVLLREPEARRAALVGAQFSVPVPVAFAARLGWPLLRVEAAISGVRADAVRADLAALPAMVDSVDAWIASSDLGGDLPTAADYQVAGSLRLLISVGDLDPFFAGRPAAQLALRLIPSFPGPLPPGALPEAWLP